MARILYVIHQYFPYSFTGTEQWTRYLAREMQALGHNVNILSTVPPGYEIHNYSTYIHDGVRVIPYVASRLERNIPSYKWDDTTVAYITSTIEVYRPDIVHVMHPMWYPEAREVAASYGIPTVLRIADFWYLCPKINLLRPDYTLCASANLGRSCEVFCGIKSRKRFSWAQKELSSYDRVFVPTNYVKDIFTQEGFDTSDWIVQVSGAYTDTSKRKLRSPKGPLRIRFLGTVYPHKGVHVLLDAVSQIPDAPLELYIHGTSVRDETYYWPLRKAIKEERRDRRVFFRGAYTKRELPEILDDTDVVVVPSICPETESLVAKAAMAAGVPVICTGPSGVSEIVGICEGGWVVPMGDAGALAGVIEALANDPSLVVKVSAKIAPVIPGADEASVVDNVYRGLIR